MKYLAILMIALSATSAMALKDAQSVSGDGTSSISGSSYVYRSSDQSCRTKSSGTMVTCDKCGMGIIDGNIYKCGG